MEAWLAQNLARLANTGRLRSLTRANAAMVDLCSNDYLGFARRGIQLPSAVLHGASGSRLLTGNSAAMEELEASLAEFHATDAALVFGSGYEANLGLISALLDRSSLLIYDAWIHRSVRDACRIALGQSLSFRHNDLQDLASKLAYTQHKARRILVCVESLYSMDGDLCPLRDTVELCEQYGAALIVDEAHSTGIFGTQGEGLVQEAGLAPRVFARVHTFSKALGVLGAAVVGSHHLKQYLINHASSYIYTTALPNCIVQGISSAYKQLATATSERKQLQRLIQHFQQLQLPYSHSHNPSPIQSLFPPDSQLLPLSAYLRQHHLLLLPIRAPSVPKDQPRLRLCLHAFNSSAELDDLCTILHSFVNQSPPL